MVNEQIRFSRREDACAYKANEQIQPSPSAVVLCILVMSVALTIFACEYYIDQLQLPWWGILPACAVAIFFTLPVGILTATSNQMLRLNAITEYLMGLCRLRPSPCKYVL